MKNGIRKGAAILLALALLLTVAAAEDYLPVRQYTLNENGEAIVDDVAPGGPEADIGQNGVFYEIFVGSFSDSDGDGIGDLRGIINRLDYLNDGDPDSGLSLGVDGLWLTPIFPSSSYHKYDVEDYYSVDPAFGTVEDLKELVTLCHERGMKVILDLPINHASSRGNWYRFFYNARLMHNSKNAYFDFFSTIPAGSPNPPGRKFIPVRNLDVLVEANFSDDMPELNFDNEAVRQAVLDVARFWLEAGVDGFRFDAAKYIYYGDHEQSVAFWDWYVGELKKIRSDLYVVAEVWDGERVTDRYTPVMNTFNFAVSQQSGLIAETAKHGDVNRFTAYIQRTVDRLKGLNPDAMNILFIANHDTDRCAGYLTVASGSMQMAANLYLLSPGSPFIYYGEEIGLRGSRGGANTDANRRLAMLWGDGDTVADPVGTTYLAKNQTPYSVRDLLGRSESIYTYYKRLLMIRRAYPEIAAGDYRALALQNTKVGGFVSTLEGSSVAVLHNTTNRDITVNLAGAGLWEGFSVAETVGFGTATLEGTVLTLSAQTSVILK